MSIIIKGLDMPKNGDYTFHFASDENGKNTIVLIRNNLTGTVLVNNGVVEIPTPHGRLIDKDELLGHLKKDPLFSLVEQYGISGVIESRPTILEAEGE